MEMSKGPAPTNPHTPTSALNATRLTHLLHVGLEQVNANRLEVLKVVQNLWHRLRVEPRQASGREEHEDNCRTGLSLTAQASSTGQPSGQPRPETRYQTTPSP